MVAPVDNQVVGEVVQEGGLHVEESGSFLATIGSLLGYFTPAKEPEARPPAPRTVGIGVESYEEMHRRIAAVRYEVISLRAQIEAFKRMDTWSQQVDLNTLRRPDLEKVGRRLQAKEEELSELLSEQEVMEQANVQYVKVEALCFEEDYLRYLITEILDKGDPESPLTSDLICSLGSLKRDLLVEREKLDDLRIVSESNGPNRLPHVN